MKKPTILLTVLGVFVFLGCFTACTSVSARAAYLVPVAKPPSFDSNPFGGYGFGASIDTQYTRFTMDIYPWTQKDYPDAYSPLGSSYTFYGKFPIELGAITLYPLAGFGLPFGLTAGAGIDIPIGTQFAFRSTATYGFGGYAYELGKTGALAVNAGLVWVFSAGGVNVVRAFADRTLSMENHAKVLLSKGLRIMSVDSTSTTIQAAALVDLWVILPPGTHTLAGVRMSSVDASRLAPETSRQYETGGEEYLYYFRTIDVNENGLQDMWMGTALLQEGHYYLLIFRDDGLAPSLMDITSTSLFSSERTKINKTLRIK
jgi:hypothetical protein